ncbi:MAG: rubrerythrin family protein, partial [Rhizobiales bacterium]|nr:rubrerythrin family protein [Hyphomicrobiales bacterium]
MLGRFSHARSFSELSEQEILALSISSEEDDARIYLAFANSVRDEFPGTAAMLEGMAEEEGTHRNLLIELHKKRFGDEIPLIRREHVAGYYARKPIWLIENLGIDRIRAEISNMEDTAQQFYQRA